MNVEDVRYSLYRFIERRANELGYNSPSIYPGPSVIPQNRPIWIIQETPGALNERKTRYMSLMTSRFNVMMLTSGGIQKYHEASRWNAHLQEKVIANGYKMTSVLVDFEYPAMISRVVEDAGNIDAGTYRFAVCGLNHIDETQLTLPSPEISVVVAEDDSRIDLVIPRHDGGKNWFSKYRLYGATGVAALKVLDSADIPAHSTLPTLVQIESFALGAAVPPSVSEIKYRFLEIEPSSLSMVVTPEPGNESGGWMGMASLTIAYPAREKDPLMDAVFPVSSQSTAFQIG